MKTRLIGSVGILAATLMTVFASPGVAHTIKQRDGNDTKGPLDLSGVVVKEVKGGNSFQITTKQRLRNADVGLKNRKLAGFFEVLLDTNADRRFDYFAEVFHFKGRFRGVFAKRSGDIIALLKASRVSRRTVRVIVPHSKVPNRGSYDFGVLSAYLGSPCSRKHPCVDVIPNRFPLLRLDFTPPTVTGRCPSTPVMPRRPSPSRSCSPSRTIPTAPASRAGPSRRRR